MRATPSPPEEDERHRRSFRLLTFLIAVVASTIAVVVTATQWSHILVLGSETASWWWKFLGMPTVLLPILLGVVVAIGAVTRGWSSRSRATDPQRVITEPIDPDGPLERAGWRISEIYLILAPLTVSTLPTALITPGRFASPSAFHVIALYATVATVLGSVAMTGLRRLVYLCLIQLVTALSFLSAARDPATAGVFSFYAVLLSGLVYTASLALQRVAFVVDRTQAQDEARESEAAELTARMTEAGRIDALVHDHILSALLLTARAPVADAALVDQTAQVRKNASIALETLDEIARPDEALDIEPFSPHALHTLLESRVRELTPDVKVQTTGGRTAPIPGRVGHTIVAAACEAVRNSLRHAGSRAATGGPVERRIMVHSSEMGLTTTIIDNGAGFDPARVPQRRLGLRGSIMRRMESLPGGGAEVDSAIGEGTRVSLSWVDPIVANEAKRSGATSAPAHAWQRHEQWWLPPDDFSISDAAPFLRGAAVMSVVAFVGMVALTLPLFHPPWVPWLSLAILAGSALLCGIYLMTVPRKVALPRTQWFVILLPTLVALGIWGYQGSSFPAVEIWQIVATAIVLMIYTLLGLHVATIFGTLSVCAVLIFWPNEDFTLISRLATAATFVVFAGAVHLINRWVLAQFRLASYLQVERALRHIRENETLVQLESRKERSAELDALVRPLLVDLASGVELTEQIKQDAALTETELRNGLRAKIFSGTTVVPATREAFRRGVTVELLDDGALNNASKGLRNMVEDHVTQEIDRALTGSITVRVPPPGRDRLVTVLRHTEDGELVRTEIDAAGNLVDSFAETP